MSIVDRRLRSVDSSFVSAFGTSQVGGTDITINVHDEAYSETPLADHGRQIYLQRKLSLGVVVHELGHAFDFIRNSAPSKTYEVENAGKHGYMRPFGFKQIEWKSDATGEYGLYDDPAYTSGFGVYWFSFPYKKNDDEGRWRDYYQNSGEIFADLFVAWVFHYWPPLNRPDEHFRKNWTEGFMSDPSGWGPIVY